MDYSNLINSKDTWYNMKQFVKSFQRVVPLFLLSDYTAQLHFTTGDLLFTLPKRSDTGLYSCEVVNEHGLDMASTKVIIQGESDLSVIHRYTELEWITWLNYSIQASAKLQVISITLLCAGNKIYTPSYIFVIYRTSIRVQRQVHRRVGYT